MFVCCRLVSTSIALSSASQPCLPSLTDVRCCRISCSKTLTRPVLSCSVLSCPFLFTSILSSSFQIEHIERHLPTLLRIYPLCFARIFSAELRIMVTLFSSSWLHSPLSWSQFSWSWSWSWPWLGEAGKGSSYKLHASVPLCVWVCVYVCMYVHVCM